MPVDGRWGLVAAATGGGPSGRDGTRHAPTWMLGILLAGNSMGLPLAPRFSVW